MNEAIEAAWALGNFAGEAVMLNPDGIEFLCEAGKFLSNRGFSRLVGASSYEKGLFTGRLVMGFLLSPLGVSAGIGDFLTNVEEDGPSLDGLVDSVLFGDRLTLGD